MCYHHKTWNMESKPGQGACGNVAKCPLSCDYLEYPFSPVPQNSSSSGCGSIAPLIKARLGQDPGFPSHRHAHDISQVLMQLL